MNTPQALTARGGTAPRPVKCTSCGAENALTASTTKPVCQWCGTALVPADMHLIKPELAAPLMLDESGARAAVALWIRWNHEDVLPEFTRRARISSLSCTFWPFYYFTGVYSGWRGNGTISGGFSELIPASTELFSLKLQASAIRFFSPPARDVTVEMLGERIMAELFEDRRATVHVDFVRNVMRQATAARLQEYRESQTDGHRQLAFTEPFEAAELRLKQLLADHSKAKDIFFQQLTTKRILWPFWTAEISYLGSTYPAMVDGSAPDAAYIGGYKPVHPEKVGMAYDKIISGDFDEMIGAWSAAGAGEGIASGEINWQSVQQIANIAGNPMSGGDVNVTVNRSCFVATAAYGSQWADEVETLRRFRDHVLMNSTLGSALVKAYYRLSPPLAKFISKSPQRRYWTRKLLSPIVDWCSQRV